jgi:hypothetical protein
MARCWLHICPLTNGMLACPVTHCSTAGWGYCIGTLCVNAPPTSPFGQQRLLTTGPGGVPVVPCSTWPGLTPVPANLLCLYGQNNNGWASTCAGDSGGPQYILVCLRCLDRRFWRVYSRAIFMDNVAL